MHGREDKVYFPANLYELHTLLRSGETYNFYSGRMHQIARTTQSYYPLGENLICLDQVEELNRISRTETYIDCGSAVPLSALFHKAGHILPPLVMRVIRDHYNPAKISSTTPGGLIYSGTLPTPVSLLFNVIEVSYEIRRLKSHRWRNTTTTNQWFYHNQLCKDGSFDLFPGDVILRMRVPSNNWGEGRIRKINLGEKSLYLAMTVNSSRSYITNFRYSYALEGGEIYREREKEAHLSGRALGNTHKDIQNLAQLTASRIGVGDVEEIVQAIHKCIRIFLYQKTNINA